VSHMIEGPAARFGSRIGARPLRLEDILVDFADGRRAARLSPRAPPSAKG